ncbi:hypothetical protein [Nocardiopsis dassonvillei]|uniref:hypothetical protein n=1 Tax=Nocardiopsis dassonvillei TaxID=2014 RepID=UPI003F5723BB
MELVLLRMSPFLNESRFPFMQSIGAAESGELIPWVQSGGGDKLRAYVYDGAEPPDALDAEFFNSLAAEFILRIDAGFREKNFVPDDSVHYPSVFWKHCDSALHVRGGYSDPAYSGIKETLWGIEQAWQEKSELIFSKSSSISLARAEIVSLINKSIAKRIEISRLVARCAGW